MKRLLIFCFLITSTAVIGFTTTDQANSSFQHIGKKKSVTTEIESRPVDIWSDGTRLSGNLFFPLRGKAGEKLPAIILCHGWSGIRAHLNQTYAPHFARAGYIVLTFDYRGWGDSDSRLILKEKISELYKNGEAIVRVRVVRNIVDPLDQTEDIINCIDFIEGESLVDPERIGLWGTSYAGGHVLYVAAHDKRVQCIVSQVPSMDSRSFPLSLGRSAKKEAIQRARGEIAPVPEGFTAFNLPGTPYISRMANYAPVEFAGSLKVPMLVIVTEKEQLLDNKANGELAYNRAKDIVPARYEVMKGLTHFDIYAKGRIKAIELAIQWFDKYLKKSK